MKNISLKEMLAQDLPYGFLQDLHKILGIIYPKSESEVNENPDYGSSEAEYVLGHHRRALCETRFREVGIEHGIECEMKQPINGGCKHVQLIIGRFRLSLCHIQSPGSFPRFSYVREQYAQINEHISQTQIFPQESKPAEQSFFGIIVHTESNKKSQFGFAGIGFPNKDFHKWAQPPIDLHDIIECQSKPIEETNIKIAESEEASPKFKPNKVNRTNQRER